MRHARRPLPLPRSWLNRPADDDKNQAPNREAVLTGRGFNPGSKAYFRGSLLDAGWDVEDVEAVMSGKFVARDMLYDLQATADRAPDLNAALLRFKDLGFNGHLVEKGTGCRALKEQWDSLTRHPWWLAASRGQRSVLLYAKTVQAVHRASASLMRDIWANLGEAPKERMPVVRRFNVLSFTSADAISKFGASIAPLTDVIVLHGLDTADSVYDMLSYAMAISQCSPLSLVVYESVTSPDLTTNRLVSAAQRSGFAYLWGLSRNA